MNNAIADINSLWAIADTLQALLDTREGLDPSDPNIAALQADIDAHIQAEIAKVTGVHFFREHCKAMQARCDAMQKKFLAARLEWKTTEEKLEKYVISVMEMKGTKELKGADGLKIKLKANPPSVIITDESLIPWEFKKTVTPPPVEKIDKRDLAKALKAGREVPGADLDISGVRVDWGDPPATMKAASLWNQPEGEES